MVMSRLNITSTRSVKIILLPFLTFTGKVASVDFAVAFEGGGMPWNPTLKVFTTGSIQ